MESCEDVGAPWFVQQNLNRVKNEGYKTGGLTGQKPEGGESRPESGLVRAEARWR